MQSAPLSRLANRSGRLAVGLGTAFVVIIAVYAIARHPHLRGDVTFGDAIVGLGTLLLAVFTALLAVATFGVDKRVAEREEERRKAEIVGKARLVHSQMNVVSRALTHVIETKEWNYYYHLPTDAWDRDGAALMSDMSEADATTVVSTFAMLTSLTVLAARYSDAEPQVFDDTSAGIFRQRLQEVSEAQEIIRKLAYPGVTAPSTEAER